MEPNPVGPLTTVTEVGSRFPSTSLSLADTLILVTNASSFTEALSDTVVGAFPAVTVTNIVSLSHTGCPSHTS